MKVCQLCAVDFTLKNFLLPLVNDMKEQGWEVHSVCSDGKFISELRKNGYIIKTIPIARSINPFKHIISIIKLILYFKTEKFDLIHVHTPVASLVGRFAAWTAGVPLIVYTAHGFYFHENMSSVKKKVFVKLEKIAGLVTDVLFTQSQEDADTAIREGIVKKSHVFAIGNGVNVERFNPIKHINNLDLKKSLDIPDNAFVVGMISRLVKEKGVIDYLKSAEMINKKYKKIYFLLIGERLATDHADDVSSAIEYSKNKLNKHLILTGARSDIAELISIMNVYCLPSWREGMPRTIIEAMVMGKPVIATNIRGSREEVVHNCTGLLVPVQDYYALSGAIEKIYLNPSWTKQLGEAGRKRALEYYDESNVVREQIKILSTLFDSSE